MSKHQTEHEPSGRPAKRGRTDPNALDDVAADFRREILANNHSIRDGLGRLQDCNDRLLSLLMGAPAVGGGGRVAPAPAEMATHSHAHSHSGAPTVAAAALPGTPATAMPSVDPGVRAAATEGARPVV